MTDIKPGDKVRRRVDYDGGIGKKLLSVVAVHPESKTMWAIPEGFERPLSYGLSNYEKVVPFFEEGKTYTCEGDTFAVESVRTDSNGPMAFGLMTARTNGSIWVTKRQRNFPMWEEA